jgi:nicotinic acid mononucleotide adenylyltransferase
MIRNTNNEILKNLYGVFEDLKVKLDARSTSPNPSYKGGVVVERSKSKKNFLALPSTSPRTCFASYRDAYSDFYIRTADLAMIGFRKHFLKKVFSVALVLASVLFPTMVIAASVGFYAGTFDPPTSGEIAIVRCALGDSSVNKECQDIGKTISRVVVLVNRPNNDDPLASTRERVLMVKKALQKYGDRVEVVTTSGDSEEKTRSLLEDRNVEQLIRFIDGDSYKAVQSSPVTQDPRLLWVVVSLKRQGASPAIDPKTLPPNVKLLSGIEELKGESSTAVQKAIQAGGTMEGLFDPAVKEVIERLGLYQPVSKDLAALQKSLFDESWKDFLKDLKSACPSILNQKECADLASAWDAVSITDEQLNPPDRKDSSPAVLIYKRAQSADRWAEKYTNTALKPLQGSASYAQFKPVAEDMSSKIYQGYPDDKLFHLRKVFVQKQRPSMEPLKVSQKPAACSPPRGPYHMDIAEYTSDRFPMAFAAFLKEQFRKGSISPTELYVHNQSVEEAYAFHRRDRFTTFYFLQTRRGQLHRNIYLAVRSNPHAYRVVFSNVRSRDQEADVFCQIYHSGTFSSFHWIQAKPGLGLFVFNPSGASLKLNDKDWLLFGFKGKWTRILQEQGWQLHPLVKEGLDIGLFTHPTIKQRLVVARNVYGDDANIILDTFYKKGVRQVVYLGTSGAVANYHIGDVTIPNQVIDSNKNSVPFRRNFAHAYSTELANQVTVHDETKHGRVQTVYQETEALLLDWKSKSVAAMDVEGIYLAKFSTMHSDLKMSAFFVISDQTLGDSTINEDESSLNVIDDSVYKLVAFLLPKILAPK